MGHHKTLMEQKINVINSRKDLLTVYLCWGTIVRQRRSTNIIIYARKEAELQLLDDQFRGRLKDAKRNITTMQENETNAVNSNKNNEMDHHSSPPPPEQEPPD